MKSLINKILLLIALFLPSQELFAQTVPLNTSSSCGIDSSTGEIKDKSAEICQEDIAFNVLYLMFNRVLEQETVKGVVEEITPIGNGVKSFAAAAGSGDSIITILGAVNNIIILFAILFFSYSIIKIIYKTQTNGEFLGDRKSKVAGVILNNLAIIILLAPVGSVLVIQIIIVFLAIIAIMLGNYFWSSFLYATKIKSTVVEIDDNILIQEANTLAIGLVETNACMERTTQDILNKKFNTGSAFETVDGDENSELIQSARAVHQCINYKISPVVNGEGYVNGYNFVRPKTDGDCTDEWFSNDIEYIIADYGTEHSCGSVNYNVPNLTNLFSDDEEEATGWFDGQSISSLMSNYDLKTEFTAFKNNKKLTIKNVLGDTINAKKEKELFEGFNSDAQNLSNRIRNSIKVDDITDKKMAAKLMYARSIFILNKLLGAEKSESDLKLIDTEIRVDGNFIENVSSEYGIETLNNQAKIIYDYLEKDYCLDNVHLNKDARINVLAFKDTLSASQKFDKYNLRRENADPLLAFTCLKLLYKKNGYGFVYNTSDQIKIFADIEKDGLKYILNKEKKDEVDKYMKSEKRNLVDALTEKYVLQGYIYTVKKAVAMALTEELKKVQDEELLKKVRREGFAGAGSMMLKITMEQSNATTFKNSIQSTGQAAGGGDSFDGTYKNVIENKNQELNTTEKKMPPFDKINLITTSNYTRNISDYEKINQANQNAEKDAFDSFTGNLENMIAYPLVYIKNASGFEQGLSISQNLERCRDSNNVCISPDSHPLNALMLFGQESLNYGIMIKITEAIVRLIVVTLGNEEKDKDGGVGEQIMSKMKSILTKIPGIKVLHIIASVILIVLETISPFVNLMIFMGVFLGYVLPTIPYVAFAIAFLSWIISIFTTMISLSIYILMSSSSTGENNIELSKIWEMTGNIILKPALITIAIIFGWTLSSVSLYYVNSTIYALFTTAQDGFLLYIIKSIMVYFIYVSIIYIVIYHSFKVINKLPDEILAMLNIRGTQDGQFIESLQFERFIQAKILSDGINNMSQSVNKQIDARNARNDINNYANAKNKLNGQAANTEKNLPESNPENQPPVSDKGSDSQSESITQQQKNKDSETENIDGKENKTSNSEKNNKNS